jgi:hypothetical protein
VGKRRRQARISERLTACECCKYPISQRHHLLEVANFGDNKYTRQLCANCHELYHILEGAIEDFKKSQTPKTRNVALLDEIGGTWGVDDERIKFISNLLKLVEAAKNEIETRRAAKVLGSFFDE